MKRRLLFVLQCVVTVTLLVVIFRRESFTDDLIRVFSETRPGWLAVALAGALAVHLLCWARWVLCLQILGIPVGMARSFRFYGISLFASLFLFGPMGGDAARIALLWRDGAEKPAAAMSVLLDRIAGLVALIVGAALFTVARYSWFLQDTIATHLVHLLWAYLAGLALVLGATFLASRKGWLERLPRRALFKQQLVDCGRAWAKFSRGGGRALATLVLSFASLMIYFAVFVFCARAFGLDIAWSDIYAVMPVVDAFAALPVSLAGLGVREKLVEYLLDHLAAVPPTTAVAVSLGGFAAMSFWCLAGALCLPGYRTRTGAVVKFKELRKDE